MVKVSRMQIEAAGFTVDIFMAMLETYRQAKEMHARTIGVAAPGPPIAGMENMLVRIAPRNEFEFDRFEIACEVIDDRPTLLERKLALVGKLRALESEAIEKVIPRFKARKWEMMMESFQRIYAADRNRFDEQFVKAHRERLRAVRQIAFASARMESDIGDLTEETIDQWQPGEFPTT